MRESLSLTLYVYIYIAQLRHPNENDATSLHSPDEALIVQTIYIEILLLFILWNVTKYPCYKYYIYLKSSSEHVLSTFSWFKTNERESNK